MLRNPDYVYGSKDVQIPAKLHFGDFILQKLHKVRERTAFIDGATDTSITYGQLMQEAMNFAISLTHLGIGKGQTVAICSENRLEFFGAVIGVSCTGAVLTTINSGYLQDELKHVLNISKPDYVILSPHCYTLHGEFFRSLHHTKGLILFGNEKVDNVIKYNDLAKSKDGNGDVIVNNSLARNVRYEEFVVGDVVGQTDTLFLLYSSGTTGLPKGVMLTHLNVIGECVIPMLQVPEKLSLAISPWFHTMGLNGMLVSLANGGQSVFFAKFEVDSYLRSIEKYKIAQLYLVPPVLIAITKSLQKYDLSSVVLISSGAAPLHKESVDLVKAKFPNVIGVSQGYGMTESTLSIIKFPYKDFVNFGLKKPGCVGRAVAGVTIKIVDIETRKPLGPNRTGEICAKGFMIMKGYVGVDASEDFDDEGFYKTGDVGYYDEDRCFYIVDRLKELIKYKGYQVAPAELEALLIKHEAIRDAGVIGIPDNSAGELPLAFVVTQPGANVTGREIQDYVAGKLSNPKQLRGGVRFVDAIPRNPGGKILRKTLRLMVKSNTSKL